MFRNVTRAMATAYYHWFFLPVGNGIPEHLIGADPGVLDLLDRGRAPRPGRQP